MRRGHSTPFLALFVLLGITVLPLGLTAQEASQFTDFRTRSDYTAEELGAALFPLAVPPVQTRGVLLRPPQSPPGALLKKASVIIPVLFEFNSVVILPQYYADLDKLGAQLTAPHYLEYRVQIEGHTDNRGSGLYNQRLSEKRAQSVQQYLVQHFAIAPERLPIKGYGFSRPIAPNTSEAGRSQNRRIEVANFTR
jgi:outer membrane protein OmpA-like peptidoglycan-associated protein